MSPRYLKATLSSFPVLDFQLSTLSAAEVKNGPLAAWLEISFLTGLSSIVLLQEKIN